MIESIEELKKKIFKLEFLLAEEKKYNSILVEANEKFSDDFLIMAKNFQDLKALGWEPKNKVKE